MSKKKVVMSMIDHEVQWLDNRDEIVRVCDENLAFSHPTVKLKLEALETERRQLVKKLAKTESYHWKVMENFGHLSFWEFWHYKQGAVTKRIRAKLEAGTEKL